MSDDAIKATADSPIRNSLERETGPRRGPGSGPEPNVRSEVEFEPAWVYISYTLKTDKNLGKH